MHIWFVLLFLALSPINGMETQSTETVTWVFLRRFFMHLNGVWGFSFLNPGFNCNRDTSSVFFLKTGILNSRFYVFSQTKNVLL